MIGHADATVRVVTWEAGEALTTADVLRRHGDFRIAGYTLAPDFLILQGITSHDAAVAVRDQMELKNFHVTTSDWAPDGQGANSLEVAIISRYAPDLVVEYDPSPDGRAPGGNELAMVPPEDFPDVPVTRGFVVAYFEALGATVTALDLTDPNRKLDIDILANAQRRELVVAAAATALTELETGLDEPVTHIIGGDFGVGIADHSWNGRRLDEDCVERTCGAANDNVDDTHAILKNGLIAEFSARGLGDGIHDRTRIAYPYDTPSDTFYVAGAYPETFSQLVVLNTAFGALHYPALSLWRPPRRPEAEEPDPTSTPPWLEQPKRLSVVRSRWHELSGATP